MIPDLYKDIKIQLYERATSPLLGSFVISWCLWNYKFFLVIFSSGTAFEKIARIEIALYPNFWWDSAWVGLIYPLITTAFFIIVFPYPARLVFWITRYQQMKTKEIQQKIEDETPLTQEEARKIRSKSRSIEYTHDEEITDKDKAISELEELIKNLNLNIDAAEQRNVKAEERAKNLGNNYKSAEARAVKAETELSNWQSQRGKSGQTKPDTNNIPENNTDDSRDWKEILGGLTNLPRDRKHDNIVFMAKILKRLGLKNIKKFNIESEFDYNPSEAKYNIELLIKAGFVELGTGQAYDLTPAGRTFLIEQIPDNP